MPIQPRDPQNIAGQKPYFNHNVGTLPPGFAENSQQDLSKKQGKYNVEDLPPGFISK